MHCGVERRGMCALQGWRGVASVYCSRMERYKTCVTHGWRGWYFGLVVEEKGGMCVLQQDGESGHMGASEMFSWSQCVVGKGAGLTGCSSSQACEFMNSGLEHAQGMVGQNAGGFTVGRKAAHSGPPHVPNSGVVHTEVGGEQGLCGEAVNLLSLGL